MQVQETTEDQRVMGDNVVKRALTEAAGVSAYYATHGLRMGERSVRAGSRILNATADLLKGLSGKFEVILNAVPEGPDVTDDEDAPEAVTKAEAKPAPAKAKAKASAKASKEKA